MKSISQDATEQKNLIAAEAVNAWVWLLILNPSTTEKIYLTNNNAGITTGGNAYKFMPFTSSRFVEDGTENLSGLNLTIQDVTGIVRREVEQNRGFFGQSVTLSLYHNGIDEILTSINFRIQEVRTNNQGAQFSLGNEKLNDEEVPSQRFWKNSCRNNWEGTRCGYIGQINSDTFAGSGTSPDLTGLALIANVKTETWTLTYNGSTWDVVGTVSGVQADATTGVPYNNGIFSCTVNVTAPAVSDIFTLEMEKKTFCPFTLDGCTERRNEARFGGAPGTKIA